jgi:hypothetical protein
MVLDDPSLEKEKEPCFFSAVSLKKPLCRLMRHA